MGVVTLSAKDEQTSTLAKLADSDFELIGQHESLRGDITNIDLRSEQWLVSITFVRSVIRSMVIQSRLPKLSGWEAINEQSEAERENINRTLVGDNVILPATSEWGSVELKRDARDVLSKIFIDYRV